MEKFPLGSHIKVARRFYAHHGIYVGQGQVIHYTDLEPTKVKGQVTKTTLEEFASGETPTLVKHSNPRYSPLEVIKRAESRLNYDDYNIIINNCEHFCNWCVEDSSLSMQVVELINKIVSKIPVR
ncbi:MAG: lecithin retinol acyltransferase family protein [Deltaproteobacteria bacterium]|jgi:hypothetical protein|nr:lecithin retinol acyltransferase family protein [Deltaproteobacteria bacterium]